MTFYSTLCIYVFIGAQHVYITCSALTIGEKLLTVVQENIEVLLQRKGDADQSRRQWLEKEKIVQVLFPEGTLNERDRAILSAILAWGPLDVREFLAKDCLQELRRYGVFSTEPLEVKISQLLAGSIAHKKEMLEFIACFLLETIIKIEGTKDEHTEQIKHLADNLNVTQKGLSGATSFLHILYVPNRHHWHKDAYESEAAPIYYLVRKCVTRNAEVNVQDRHGVTPLHLAAQIRDFDLCKLLICHGANPSLRDYAGNTPLHVAIFSDYFIMPNRELKYIPDLDYMTDSDFIEKQRVLKICRLLKSCVNEKNTCGDTPLHRACMCELMRITETTVFISPLLKYGADKNAVNIFQQTPLHVAATRKCVKRFDDLVGYKRTFDIFGNQPVHYVCALAGDIQAGEQLEIEFFTDDLVVTNESGWTALHIACFFNRKELVNVLLNKYHVNVNAQIHVSGKTPFMIACEKGHKDICELFLEHDSFDVRITDKTCGTALEWLCEFDQINIFEELLKRIGLWLLSTERKAAFLRMICQQNKAEFLRLFFYYWECIDEVNDRGDTVLHIACSRGYRDVVEALLIKHTYTSLGGSKKNRAHKTARSCATTKGHLEISLRCAEALKQS